MNARDQAKAEVAKQRRHEDVRDAVIEAIGELLYRRSQRVAKPEDLLFIGLGIGKDDYHALGDIAAGLATDETPAVLKAAFLVAHDDRSIRTVDDLATAVERVLDAAAAKEPAQ